jgi:SAM-dependent methyltransferase
MNAPVSSTVRIRQASSFKSAGLFLRGLLFLGWRYRCSCCQWPLRAFVTKGGLWRTSADGYCPRCNAKARHRRHSLYYARHPELFVAPVRLLEIAPWRALAAALRARPEVTHYIGLDRAAHGPHVTVVGDAGAIPLADNCCDLVVCIHVLEHISDDRGAIAELFRVLRHGGQAIISVPLRLDQPTLEDSTVTTPAERKRMFGEEEHVRYYGLDITERLRAAGFDVAIDLASDVPSATRKRYGLRNDENIFHCRKPGESAG